MKNNTTHISVNTSLFAKQQSGFSLIEVLFTVLIMSIGMLGIAGIQLVSLKNNDSTLSRVQTNLHSNAILDLMRANRQAAITGDYNISYSDFDNLSSGQGIATTDLLNWKSTLTASVASAKGAIDCINLVCTVSVQWDDSHAEGNASTQQTSVILQL